LYRAIEGYRAALALAARTERPLDWAATQTELGAALLILEERERGTARLEEAVAAYRAALEERTRERMPLEWAQTQSAFAMALAIREGREGGRARLEEAVAAYRAALEEATASACRSPGPGFNIISATRFRLWRAARTGRRSSKRRSPLSVKH